MIVWLLSLITIEVLAFSCKNQNNEDVDWFAVYKMPVETDRSVPGIRDGLAFYYVDANMNGILVPSPNSLGNTEQAIAYTLMQFYSRKDDPAIFHVMYNDEPAIGTLSSLLETLTLKRAHSETIEYGHTKGCGQHWRSSIALLNPHLTLMMTYLMNGVMVAKFSYNSCKIVLHGVGIA
ncbi:deoxyribonuclease-2 domain protein [Dictyocaulus viviparus]|uniref:Deoxyribonuclease-2 domain protein n=1 Tax=Dictyocaulus viviparus TaxID=29172 RepID=A0A0D8XDV2_DICVI|nr:deoxyribonuclease-2 domain protein [Dictyocaulus viviparus]